MFTMFTVLGPTIDIPIARRSDILAKMDFFARWRESTAVSFSIDPARGAGVALDAVIVTSCQSSSPQFSPRMPPLRGSGCSKFAEPCPFSMLGQFVL